MRLIRFGLVLTVLTLGLNSCSHTTAPNSARAVTPLDTVHYRAAYLTFRGFAIVGNSITDGVDHFGNNIHYSNPLEFKFDYIDTSLAPPGKVITKDTLKMQFARFSFEYDSSALTFIYYPYYDGGISFGVRMPYTVESNGALYSHLPLIGSMPNIWFYGSHYNPPSFVSGNTMTVDTGIAIADTTGAFVDVLISP